MILLYHAPLAIVLLVDPVTAGSGSPTLAQDHCLYQERGMVLERTLRRAVAGLFVILFISSGALVIYSSAQNGRICVW